MIPERIIEYLRNHGVAYERRFHRRAITAQELAAAVHLPGRQVAKSVMVKANGQIWIAVLPATELVDEDRLAPVLGARSVHLLHESEFESLFPDCEAGAEPPFGGLYGLPVVIDSALAKAESILFRAGSHEEAIEMRYEDFYRLEGQPMVGAIGRSLDRIGTAPLWTDWPQWCER
jgi:Ala-tRNA(Pro) deacylase